MKGYASLSSPFWDAANSGTGFQNIKFTNGYVGIGVDTPRTKLDIAGGVQPLRVNSGNNSTDYFVMGFNNANSAEFTGYNTSGQAKNISLNGNGGYVGVSRTDAAYPLDVNGVINTNSNIQASGTITALDNNKAPGTPFINVGDDAFLTDVDQANTLAVYGQQNPAEAKIKLGNTGKSIYVNSSGDMCLGNC